MGENAVLISMAISSSSLAFKASVIYLLLNPMRTGSPSNFTGIESLTFPTEVSQEMDTFPSSNRAFTGFFIFSLIMMEARLMLSANSRAERTILVFFSLGIAVL